MNVYFFNFSKRANSTKTPATSAGVQKVVRLKHPTTAEAPYIILNETAETLYDYAYIPKWGKYYHVMSQQALTAETTGYQLQEDYLASYKNEVLELTTYVVRSASDPDLYLHDDYWMHNGVIHNKVQTVNAFTGDSDGCIVVGLVNGSPLQAGMGGISYVAFDVNEFRKLVTGLFSASTYSGSATDDVKYYFNPFQYIVSCYYVPLTPSAYAGGETRLLNVGFGWWTYSATNAPYLLLGRGQKFTFNFTPGGTFANWTNRASDWTNMEMYVPGIGFFSLDSAYYGVELTGELSIDYATGACTLVIGVPASGNVPMKTVLSKTGQFGKNIQLSQLSVDKLQYMEDKYNYQYGTAGAMWSGIGNIAGGILSGNAQGFASGISAGIGDFFSAGHKEEMNNARFVKTISNPALSLAGYNDDSKFISDNASVKIFTHYYEPYHLPTTFIGGAKYQSVKLSTLSGFTQVLNGAVDINGTASEKQAIKNLLEGGFFIE